MYEFSYWLSTTPVSLSLALSGWFIPTAQIIHILSIAALIGSVLIINLRVLRVGKTHPGFGNIVEGYGNWFWAPLGVLLASGFMLILAEPERQLLALSFWIKMALLIVASAIFARFLMRLKHAEFADGNFVSPKYKAASVANLVLWVCIIFLGRFIAYDVQIWDSLSPMAYL
jgi:hypothetical protein